MEYYAHSHPDHPNDPAFEEHLLGESGLHDAGCGHGSVNPSSPTPQFGFLRTNQKGFIHDYA